MILIPLFYFNFICSILCKSTLQCRKISHSEIFEKFQCEIFMTFYISSSGTAYCVPCMGMPLNVSKSGLLMSFYSMHIAHKCGYSRELLTLEQLLCRSATCLFKFFQQNVSHNSLHVQPPLNQGS